MPGVGSLPVVLVLGFPSGGGLAADSSLMVDDGSLMGGGSWMI